MHSRKMITMKFLFILFLGTARFAFSQFPGAVGSPNTTAIAYNDPLIVSWADSVLIERGPEDVSISGSPFVSYGQAAYALGEVNSNVVSLGDGGKATYFFSAPIVNEPGFDFAVFENGFSDQFLELAFVEVSSDGVNFVRFPAQCFIQDSVQIATYEASGDATKIHNLAGKYRVNYGTPFELDDLIGSSNLDINQIHYVRVIDVVGSIEPNFGSTDINGNYINDPYPGGFDLDAIAVFHMEGAGMIENVASNDFLPSFFYKGQEFHFNEVENIVFIISDELGRKIETQENRFIAPKVSGNYFITILNSGHISQERVLVY
jgi:hypothetical protein